MLLTAYPVTAVTPEAEANVNNVLATGLVTVRVGVPVAEPNPLEIATSRRVPVGSGKVTFAIPAAPVNVPLIKTSGAVAVIACEVALAETDTV